MTKRQGSDRWPEIEMALDALFELDEAERGSFLEELAARDAELGRAVERLVEAEREAPTFLEENAVAVASPALGSLLAEDDSGPFSPGDLLGPYRLVRLLGQGGMSQVYLGERADGEIEQQVAIKFLGPLGGSPQFHRRFQAERQILALLRHPGIARILDAGTAESGAAYLVMELVEGLPIDAHCRQNALDLHARLRLLEQVCSAVEAAHRRLIVHRDLKPSNILVTQDGPKEGQVKLLDFGIAKLLDPGASELADAPLTRTGQLLMTPEYAAPEQIRGEPVTIASDVYALGIVLYELLTGRRPHQLTGLSPAETERAVTDGLPARPSTVAESVGDGIREAEEGWRRDLRGDLDTITLKAIHPEPEARYGSATDLRRDLERFRKGLPIAARPATLSYRIGKFASRHRWGVAAAVAGLVLSLVFVGLLVTERASTERERDRAQEESLRAQLEATKAGRVTDFLLGLFRASAPRVARGEQLTALDLLERGVSRADELADEPLVQAEMLSVLGSLHGSLGRIRESDALLTRAVDLRTTHLGEGHADVAATRYILAITRWRQGDIDSAEELLRQCVAAWSATGAPELVDGKRRLGRLLTDRGEHEEAERLLTEALAVTRQSSPELDLTTAHLLRNLAILREGQHRLEDAEVLLQEAYELAARSLDEADPAIGTFIGSLSAVLFYLERFPEAEALARQGLERTRKAYPPGHAFVATLLGNLGLALKGQERYEEAEVANLEALEIRRAAFGEEHPEVADNLNNLGSLALVRGRLEEAERYLIESMEMRLRMLGEGHPKLLDSFYLNGQLEMARQDPESAKRYFERALALSIDHHGESHSETENYRELLASAEKSLSGS